MTALRFLLLEDNACDAELVQGTLTAGGVDCELLRVDTHAGFVKALETNEFDLVLADYSLPGFNGIAALEIACNLCPDTPFIVVSASLGEEVAIEMLKRGATDYVLKHRLERLVPCVQRALQEAQERYERKQTARLLVEQKRLLELTASGQPLNECLAAVCASVSQLNSHSRACFLLTDAQQLTFSQAITPDFPPSFGQGLKHISISDLCTEIGSEAVDCGQPVTCPDIAKDDRCSQGWLELCGAHGILAFYATPVLGQDNLPLGFLMLCFGETRMPTAWEHQLADFSIQVASIVFEREQSILALRASEHQYRTLFESMDEGFCLCEMLFDQNGEPIDYRFLEVNPVFEMITGLEQVIGKTARELVPGLESDWFEVYGRVVLTGKPVRFENQSVAMNRWFDINAFQVGEPQSHRFAILFTNINERKQAEAALRQNEERFQAFMNHSPAAAWITDRDGRILYLSQTYFRTFEFPTQDVIGKTIFDIYPTNVAQQFLDNIQQAADTHTVVETIEIAPRSDGTMGNFLVYKFPITDESGAVLVGGVAVDITERTRVEAALRESEGLKQRILESSHDCIKVLTLDGRLLYISAGGIKLFEVDDPAALLNTEWVGFWQGEDRENARAAIAGAREGKVGQFQGYCPTTKGTAKWWDVVVTPIPDASGQITQLLAISRDITQKRQAEAVLRDSEERFRNMADNAPVMVWVTDSTGYCTYLSQSWYDFTGQTEATGLGYGWLNTTHPEDQEYAKEAFLQANERREVFRLEYRLRHWDGEYHWAIDTASPWFGVDGEYQGYIGSVIDITERKEAEVALQQSEERYRYLAELIPQLVWTANAEGTLLDVNQRWSTFTGLTITQAQLAGWEAVVHPDDIAILGKQWATAQQEGTSYQAEGRMRRADGLYRWHLHQAVPMKNEQGQVIKWFGTATDIEEQKQLEQQRDRILQREQAARADAEQANRIKDEFLAVLSHELRSPLNPILGWTRLLQSGKLDAARQTNALETIERNAKLQSQLIEDLLDISRIIQGKLTLTAAPVSLTFVISAAVETVRLAAEAKNIQITLDLDPTIAPICGDAARLQQVLWNLLSNAVKFTPNGGGVTVELRQLDRLAYLRVMDTGKGINPQFLPYVFEYFRQEDGSTTRRFGGLGLGLAIVQQIVEMHGGTVRAESLGENQGATFIVQLPIMQVKSPLSELTRTQAESPAAPLNNLKILMVDDDTDTREFQAFLLEQNGAKVTAVASGLEALQVLEQFIPDVIVSDVGMAEMDGYRLMQQIRSRPLSQGRPIPAIALTAYAAELDQQKALQSGFQMHITKPVEPEILVRGIVNLLDHK